MAAMLREGLTFVLFCSVLFYTSVAQPKKELEPCKPQDFVPHVLPCDVNREKKVVYYLKKTCDLNSNTSTKYPPVVEGVPCDCLPGEGEVEEFPNITCKKCQPGLYSHGGEMLDDWTNWNKTGIPGHALDVFPYCSDFLTAKRCSTWQSRGNGAYLISGTPKNSSDLHCFEQSILALSRNFVGKSWHNQISFRYKVDGSPCRRGATVCSNGLHFYINNALRLRVDSQFQWTTFNYNISAGFNQFKFVYQKSCTRDQIEDVAYLQYISMVGTETPNTKCIKCPPGTFSYTQGANNCKKCSQNFYQDQPGQKECKPCKANFFSRLGGTKCEPLPPCTLQDYYFAIEDIKQCRKKDGKWILTQTANLPLLPGNTHNSCINKTSPPEDRDVPCACQPGYALSTSGTPKCIECKTGTTSDGTLPECKTCPKGSAAIPGLYLDFFPGEKLTSAITQRCSGDCPKTFKKNVNIWEPRGQYLATHRFAGNFDSVLEFPDVHVDYINAKVSFNCSVDCRMTYTKKPKLAKHNHCYLKMTVKKGNKTMYTTDCVSRYYHYLRNGTVRHHEYRLREPGNYSFSALFHHEDEANISFVSYEARIHYVHILGAVQGSSKACVECPAGTKAEKNLCVECPVGTYSRIGSIACTPCPNGSFSDVEGSKKCIPCGSGTTSNAMRDGCDYGNCTFSPAEGIVYDLSPLKVVNGSMYRVRNYNKKAHHYFPLIYHINICSLSHDNSSCLVKKRRINRNTPQKRLEVYKEIYLKTMACKRWSFDKYQSYPIGRVLNFLPLKNISSGLMINLTHGYQCWHKPTSQHVAASTSIIMQCDPNAGVGKPEARSNDTSIDKYCHYELLWRTVYACPLCRDKDYSKVYSKCINGKRYVTNSRLTDCRLTDNYKDLMVEIQNCSTDDQESGSSSNKTLVIVLIVLALIITILIVFVVYYARRNRYLRDTIFLPGKSFSKVQDDEDELVDNMHM